SGSIRAPAISPTPPAPSPASTARLQPASLRRRWSAIFPTPRDLRSFPFHQPPVASPADPHDPATTAAAGSSRELRSKQSAGSRDPAPSAENLSFARGETLPRPGNPA